MLSKMGPVFVLVMTLRLYDVTSACQCDEDNKYCDSEFILRVKVLDETKVLNFKEDVPGSMFNDQQSHVMYNIEVEEIYRTTGPYAEVIHQILYVPGNVCKATLEPGHTYIIIGKYTTVGAELYLGDNLCAWDVKDPMNAGFLESFEEEARTGFNCPML